MDNKSPEPIDKVRTFFDVATNNVNKESPSQRKTEKIDEGTINDILEKALQKAIHDGFRIESQTERSAVVIRGRPTNHVFHLVMFIITSTFWWPVWLFFTIRNRTQRQLIVVDEFGNVDVTKVKN